MSELGEVVGLFVRKGAGAAGAAAGGIATVLAGPVAGVVMQETVREATDGYFVPVVRTGGRVGALGAAAALGLAAGLVVTLAHHGGQFVVRQIWGGDDGGCGSSVEFTTEDDADFSVICLPTVAAMSGSASPCQTHSVGSLADNRGGVAADTADNISGAADSAAQEPQNIGGASGHFYDRS